MAQPFSLLTISLCSEYEREQKKAVKREEEEEDDEDMVFGGGLRIPGAIWHKLYR